MLNWLKSLFGPVPSGPPQIYRAFSPGEPTIAGVKVEDDAFVVQAAENTIVPLFEIEKPGLETCMVTYKANAKAEDLAGKAYLEMQFKFPKKGEHTAKGLDSAVSGSTDWIPVEAPVFLDGSQQPDSMKLNLVVEGKGTIRLKDVEITKTPVA
jgi:hypothetical protein